MAEIKQGQRSVPGSGMNVLGAYRAGRGTPAGSGLQPEAEHMIRLQMIGLLTEIKKAELDINRQALTSQTNVIVSNLTARANLAAAGVSLAKVACQSECSI